MRSAGSPRASPASSAPAASSWPSRCSWRRGSSSTWSRFRWDPYPFILLNLAFSTQAAYAAPLILLAQNRQDNRDRAQAELDREVNARTQADTEYLARELASVRLALADAVTVEELRNAVAHITDAIEVVGDRLARLAPETAETAETADG
jgi:uncharacterized membrane protein